MRREISLIVPIDDVLDVHLRHDESPPKGLCADIYRFAVISFIFFYSGVLFSYVPFVVGVIQPKELVLSAYLFGFVFFAQQIYLTVEEFVELRRNYLKNTNTEL
jgi:uncharacterized membrane protein YcfT